MLYRLHKLLSGSSPSILNKPALPGDADANLLLKSASALERDGNLASAEEAFRKVLTISPAHPEATHRLGILLAQRGDYLQAEPLLHSATLLAPRNSICFIDLGNALRDQRRFEEAIVAYRSGIAIEPSADSCFRLASALWEAAQPDAARQAYRQAIELRPDFADAYSNLACIEKVQGHLEECIRNAELALSCDPGHYIAHDTLGHALQFLGRIEEATDHYRLAISRRADYVQAYGDLGNALGELGRFDEAMAAFDRALEIQPDFPDAQWNRGLFWLVRGDFKRGWEGYEKRFHTHVAKKEYLRDFKQPVWKGEDLHGKTILLHAEQGFGDAIQFVRFVPLIAAQGATVYLEVPSALEGLVRDLPGVAAVFSLGAALPPFDVYCSLMSLPHRLGTRLETIPCDIPYLAVPDALAELWKKRLAALPGLKVGLVWSGNPGNPMDAQRSISLDHIRMLFDLPGISFVSLQKCAANSPVTIQENRLHDWMDECADFLDTAALILALDLVIAIDTSVAHLAGALGKPVWMLNRFNTDWRWLQGRNDSPWYPSLRIFRQDQLGDWTTPIARLRTALDEAAQAFAESGRFVNPPLAATQAVQTPEATDEVAAEAAKNAGNAAYSNGDLEQAEQHYHRAVTLNPDYAEGHNNLALVLRAQQKYLEAEKHLLRAIAAKPDLSNAYFNLGCLFVDTGRTADAAVQFKKTLALNPDNANAYVELANLMGSAT